MPEQADRRPDGLTKRQKQILEYLRLGCTNQEIARLFNISVNTVKTHLAALYRELGASNRTEAVHMSSQAETPLEAFSVADTMSQPESPPNPNKLVVVPFTPTEITDELSAEAAALTETVSLHLTRWRRFPLIAYPSHPDSCFDLSDLHAKLGVKFAVAASLHQDAAGLRLNVRLLSPCDGQLHWAQEFDVPDAFAHTRAGVGAHASATLVSALLKTESQRLLAHPPESLRSWEKVTLGLHLLETRTTKDTTMAAELFSAALGETPGLLLAHYGLAVANYLSVLEQWDKATDVARVRVHENARACVRIDSDSPDTSVAMGLSHILADRPDDAIAAFLVAANSNPGLSSAFTLLGQLHALRGDAVQASRYLEEGVRVSRHTPAYLRSQGSLAILRFVVGDYTGTITACRTCLLYDTGYVGFRALLVSASALAGDPETVRIRQSFQQATPNFRLEQLTPLLRDVPDVHRRRFMEGLRLAGFPVMSVDGHPDPREIGSTSG